MKEGRSSESPMSIKISFNKLIEHYEELAENDDKFLVAKAERILEIQNKIPELRDGFSDLSLLDKYKNEIEIILEDSFSEILTKNEIKAASVPFENIIFNSSERFKSILKTAGDDFKLEIINLPEDSLYITACSVILNFYYGYKLNFKRPFFYEIPDGNGVRRYYKILYNADFGEIIKTDAAKEITEEDYRELLDNYGNIELWKEKFPPNSYIYKGFVISNMFDVTDDQSISNIKSNLIGETSQKDQNFVEEFHEIFRSLFGLKELKVGFTIYNKQEDVFEKSYVGGAGSYLLNDMDINKCSGSLCRNSYTTLLREKRFYSVADVNKYYNLSKGKAPQYKSLKEQGIQSAILAPIVSEDELLGILEIVSEKPYQLNSINANKLVDVMPYIVSAVLRSNREEENLIEAILQQECTSIEPSVHWKFEEEARRFLRELQKGNQVSFRQISFEEVYPLFGQIDIKGSSNARNYATKADLILQLNLAKVVVTKIYEDHNLPIYDQIIYQINNYLENLELHFQVDSEQQISHFFKNEITPLFKHLEESEVVKKELDKYYDSIDDKLNSLYKNRKNYDDTITMINKHMATLLDDKQVEAQMMYPHYFERFKTDGVEHNMYIGESITKETSFNRIYLYNLRLWQLQVMCEMENTYYNMQSEFPIQLDVASMILVFNSPLSISFRMDEKRFDVDGTYNARYEIVKKRVDKANIKGTNKRITEKGKISIVYSQKEDEIEYMRYIKFLQSKHYLGDEVEILELEDLQAVTGLKAIRVNVLYHRDSDDKEFYTYNDLMKELKS